MARAWDSETWADRSLYPLTVANLKDEAICIRQWDWSETSQTVSLFTRNHGILRGIAKGSKREKSPFSGGIELATRGEIVAIVKAHSSADSLATFTSWDLQETFPAVRRTHLGFRIAMAILDSLGRAMREIDPHPALFDGTLQSLRTLDRSPTDQHAALISFLFLLLKETGHAPELFVDVRNGAPISAAAILGFSPARGGVTNISAIETDSNSFWRVRGETIEFLRAISKGQHQIASIPQTTLRRGISLLSAYLCHVLESDIPALSSLQSRDPLERGT